MPIGTEIVLPAAGALTATGHLSSLWLTIVVALGRRVGGRLGRLRRSAASAACRSIERYGKYVHFTHERLLRRASLSSSVGERFAIFICRFLPVVRGIARDCRPASRR